MLQTVQIGDGRRAEFADVVRTLDGRAFPTLDALLHWLQTESEFVEALKNSASNNLLLMIKNRSISDVDEFRNFCEQNSYFGLKQAKDYQKILEGKIPNFLTPRKMLQICEEKGILQLYIDYRVKPCEAALNVKIQYVNLIPPNYRYPLALDEIYSYLANLRAENWKEAVNLYEEQLHRWQMEVNSEEALLLQAQAAALAGKASSRAGTAALFSSLSFFFK